MSHEQLVAFLNKVTTEMVQKQTEYIAYLTTQPGIPLDEIRFQAGRLKGISDYMEVLAYKLKNEEELV